MSHVSTHSAERPALFNEYIAGALTAVVLALSAVLVIAQFAA